MINLEQYLNKEYRHLLSIGESEKNASKSKKLLETNILRFFHESGGLGKKSLIVGKVQSGKTATFIGAAIHALNHEYDCVIIVAGTTNKLLKQTKERIDKTLGNNKTRKEHRINNEITVEINDTENQDSILKSNSKLIVVCLKNKMHLEKIAKRVSEFPERKFLIIDDEGDYFSLSADAENVKPINTELANLVRENTYFVSVTATPQGNLLFTKDKLFPDFWWFIEPNDSYTGLDFFHGENNIAIDNNATNGNRSLKKALVEFIVLASLWEASIDEQNEYAPQMLVHWERENQKHKKIIEDLNIIKDTLISNFMQNEWTARLKDVATSRDIACDIDLALEICEFILRKDLKIIELNQNNEEEVKSRNTTIFVGGDMMGRGLTFENLIVCHFIRDVQSKHRSFDTFMQRARWLGFRKDKIKFMKIFLSKDLDNVYKDILSIEENLWNSYSAEEPISTHEKIQFSFTELVKPTSRLKTLSNKVISDSIEINGNVDEISAKIKKSLSISGIQGDQSSKYAVLNYEDFLKLLKLISASEDFTYQCLIYEDAIKMISPEITIYMLSNLNERIRKNTEIDIFSGSKLYEYEYERDLLNGKDINVAMAIINQSGKKSLEIRMNLDTNNKVVN